MFWLGMLIGAILMYVISYEVRSFDRFARHPIGVWYVPLQQAFYRPMELISILFESIRYQIWQLCQIRASIFLYTHGATWKHFKSATENWSNEEKKKFVSLLICRKETKKRLSYALDIDRSHDEYDL